MSAISLPPARTTILSYSISGGRVLITFATCRNLAPGRQVTFVFRNLSSSMCFSRFVPTTTVRSGMWVGHLGAAVESRVRLLLTRFNKI